MTPSVSAAPGDAALSARQMMHYDNNKKSVGIAFALWFFLSLFGGHRFYLGRTGTAIVMLLLTCTVFGIVISSIWALIDAFLIPGMVRAHNDRLIAMIG
ncbi:TM2 domain-containing protein [Siccirubricoccus sp. KC 17139]|uniref:TM2 domain-containing protein n=1 Tax=Siccirubricoccus soli TaxID=2899147 RepID=A0ABT1DDS6_9PROT|nr:TM2 domain-containing protein [Siccirubricoccus soli]MCO6419395.1 TM2 domain-containing protein [Siccirubricoccus soli]MCP2685530.1 TM2 domain-containing protein [Siccirubricoccus soli]